MLATSVEILAHVRDIELARYTGAESVEPPGRLIDHPDRPVPEPPEDSEDERDEASAIAAFFGVGRGK